MKPSLKIISVGCLLPLVFLLALTAGCETTGTAANPPAAAAAATNFLAGPLQIGDKIRIEITGIPGALPLPQDQTIRDDGTITFLNMGATNVVGKTPREVEKIITDALVPDYYKKATITVTPLNNRYFSVGGYVVRGDRYTYEGATTLTRAIQAAGDFNEFADKKHIVLSRPGAKPQKFNWNDLIKHPEKDPVIYPGDSIYVPRRIF